MITIIWGEKKLILLLELYVKYKEKAKVYL